MSEASTSQRIERFGIGAVGKPRVGAAADPEKEREALYLKAVPPEGSGLGGTRWRMSEAGKKHRADWEAKNPRGLSAIKMAK